MNQFRHRLALSLCALLVAVSAAAQEPTINHKPVGCIVAGKFPKLDACFSGADLASAKAYFKGGEGTVWYWVKFADGACAAAILPKPSKKLAELDYYLEIIDRHGVSARTADIKTTVVPNEGGCKKDIPVAPWLSTASVSVGAPAGAVLPATFAVGAASTGLGAAAVVGGAVVVAGGGAAAVVAVSKGSTPTATSTVPPTATATSTPSPTSTLTPTPTPTNKPTATFTPTATVIPSCTNGPLVVMSTPSGQGWTAGDTIFVAANASDDVAIKKVEFFVQLGPSPGPPVSLGVVDAPGPYELKATTPCTDGEETDYLVYAVATNVCDLTSTSEKLLGTITNGCSTGGGLRSNSQRTKGERTLAWSSRLEMPDAKGTLVVNGAASTIGTGAMAGRAAVKAPESVEVTLTEAPDRPGLWRFELLGATWDPQHVIVREGTVVNVTSQAIVFRLRGRPGERASFSFEPSRP